MKCLVLTVGWLREEIRLRNRDVGFCGRLEDIISHAAELLGPHLVTVRYGDCHITS